MDSDYKRYIEQCNKDDEYSGNIDYGRYCDFLRLLLESAPESELYSKLLNLLKIHSSVSKSVENTFDKRLWLQIMEALITKIPEKKFNTWMRGIYPIILLMFTKAR